MAITIHKKLTVNNECYKKNAKMQKVRGLTLHSIGCPQPDAERMANLYNQFRPSGRQVAVHAFLDAKGNVYQCLPWGNKAWHAGGPANNTHIGVEMTEPAGIKYVGGATWVYRSNDEATKSAVKAHVLGTYNTAVQLFAHLCKAYGLNPMADGVIISHSEGYKRGVASNHGDVEHIWKHFGLTMDGFRQDVKKAMGAGVTVKFDGYNGSTTSTPSAPKPSPSNKVASAKFKDANLAKTYTVNAKDGLRLRTAPGGTILTVLPFSTSVTCYGFYDVDKSGKWLLINVTDARKDFEKYKGMTGYVSATYLS